MPSNKVKSANDDDNGLDQELVNGPLAKRTCRDTPCCLLFLVFIGGMIGVAGYALDKGNPSLIGRGYDYDGKICGIDEGYEDYPYLYWPRPGGDYLKFTVCLKACPVKDEDGNLPSEVDCKFNTEFPSPNGCTETDSSSTDAQVAAKLVAGLADNEFYIYQTQPFIKRFCIPNTAKFKEAANTVLDSDVLDQWVSDIRETWPVILGSMGAAFVVGFIYMILLRYCSGVLTWLAIIAFIVGIGCLGWRFYKNAQKTEEEIASVASADSESKSTGKTITSEKIIAYICFATAGATILAVLCLYNRIKLAIAILKAAADYVKDTPSVFLVPPVTIVLLIGLFSYWGITAVYLVSSGDATQLKGTPLGSFEFDKTLKRLLLYHLFGLLWFNAFIIASTQFILASSTALWYFSQGTGQNAPKTIRTSIYRLFRYHFGSIAYGALILAIIQFIRLVLAYISHQAKKLEGKEGKIIRFAVRCLECYAACFQRFIEFLNKNAYIQIALGGKGFCGAARDAFKLIAGNPIRFSIVGGISSIFVLFGKVFIGAITALGGFLVITKWDRYDGIIYSPFIPTLLIFIFSYVIGAVFMTIYGLAADTILACFILDEQMNSKKNAPPRHCPESLKDFLDKHKKN